MTQIVIRKSDNLVVHSGDGLEFSPYLVGLTFMDSSITADTHKIVDDVTLPQPWADGAYTYANGCFAAIGAPSLSNAQTRQLASLNASYREAISAPVGFKSANGTMETYQADPGSIDCLNYSLAGYQSVGATPPGFYWVAADNVRVPFTYADLQGLAAAITAQWWAAFQHLQDKKAAVIAATTMAQVQAIVW